MSGLSNDKKEVLARLKAIYADSKVSKIAIIHMDIENQLEFIKDTLNLLVSILGFRVIYLTVGRTYNDLIKLLPKNLDISNVHFIDAISRLQGISAILGIQCTCVSGPINLENITSAIKEKIDLSKNDNKTFLIIDSMTAILLYNSLHKTKSFIESLIRLLHKSHISCLIYSLATSKMNQELLEEISNYVDEKLIINKNL